MIMILIIIKTKNFLRKPVNYLASEPRKPTPDSPLFTDVNPNEFLRRKKTQNPNLFMTLPKLLSDKEKHSSCNQTQNDYFNSSAMPAL